VSWVTPAPVSKPTVVVGTPHGGFGHSIAGRLHLAVANLTGRFVGADDDA
jgi:hypothetical protein